MAENSSKVMRVGKTEKDHRSGAWNNRFQNQQDRVAWQKSKDSNEKFPKKSCNGKKNRLNPK